MMSAWLAGASPTLGDGLVLSVSPSRLKIRSSMFPASAKRARVGTSRRQSDDQSSEITRIFAGPLGCAASQRMASTCASCRRVVSYAWRKNALKSRRGTPTDASTSRARFSGVPTQAAYWSKVIPSAKRSAVTTLGV